jgi:hexosaminidase
MMTPGVAVLALAAATAGGGSRPALVPWPASIEAGQGELAVGSGFRSVVSGPRSGLVERAARRFEARLARQTGLVLPSPLARSARPSLEIRCDALDQPLPHVGMDEAYTLTVAPAGAVLHAAEPWGVLRGLETFLQLVEPGVDTAFRVPAVVVRDRPRFPWRGLMLDGSRHFMPVDAVKRTLDGMAAVKLNVFRWHLTDDQGFRVESRRYPELHRQGSDGLFYTQEQVKDVIAYAGERGIRVCPGFAMPGHVSSWLVSHPELGSRPGPYRIERDWGLFDAALDPSKEEVYRFLDGFLGEMALLFPDLYVCVGGDEGTGRHWDASPRVVAFGKQKGFTSHRGLLGYFAERVARIAAGHGKRVAGGVLPLELQGPAGRHYLADPGQEGVSSPSDRDRADGLGGEATMGSEFAMPEILDSRLWPHAAAVAERLWSPREVRDVEDLYERLDAVSRWLEWLGLDHRTGYPRMLQRLAGGQQHELQMLADVVEPLEDAQRVKTQRYTQLTPLNRLVDAARPESEAARVFSRQVDALLADPARRAGRDAIRARLSEWQGLQGRLRPLLESRELLRECVPLAAEASALAGRGLEALAFLERGEKAPESWWSAGARLLEREGRSPTDLEVAYRPAVRRLAQAAAER